MLLSEFGDVGQDVPAPYVAGTFEERHPDTAEPVEPFKNKPITFKGPVRTDGNPGMSKAYDGAAYLEKRQQGFEGQRKDAPGLGGPRPTSDKAAKQANASAPASLPTPPSSLPVAAPASDLDKLAEREAAADADLRTEMSIQYPSREEVGALAAEKIPPSLRNLDDVAPAGTVLRRGPNGNAYWGPDSAGGGDTFDWSKCALGFKCNPDGTDPDAVRIYAGEINRITVSQPSPDITVVDNGFIYIQRVRATNVVSVLTAAAVPADDATNVYHPLYQFTVTDGVASIKAILRPFNIDDKGVFPSNANKTKYMVLQLSDTVGATDDSTKWTVDWVRWV